MNYWMGGAAPENASGGRFPRPLGEAEVPVSAGAGNVELPARVVGGIEASFSSPMAGEFDVAHYSPASTDDLLALLGPPSRTPRLASEPTRIWDFSFAGSAPSQLTFGYDVALQRRPAR